jgi:hypothetical protein
MPTHLDHPIPYDVDDPRKQESRRRYAWTALLYITFAAFIILLFLLVR